MRKMITIATSLAMCGAAQAQELPDLALQSYAHIRSMIKACPAGTFEVSDTVKGLLNAVESKSPTEHGKKVIADRVAEIILSKRITPAEEWATICRETSGSLNKAYP